MRTHLGIWLGGVAMACLLATGTVAPARGQAEGEAEAPTVPAATPAPAPAEAPAAVPPLAPAERAFEEASALMMVRGLGLSGQQLQLLANLMQATQQQRRSYHAQMAGLWNQHGAAVRETLTAWEGNQPAPPAAGEAQGALEAAYQAGTTLQITYGSAITQWMASLSPTQASLIEAPEQAAQREAAEGLLGSVTNPGDYLAQVADLLRALEPQTYEAVKYWQAERLVLLLAPYVPVGDPGAAAAQLVVMYDTLRDLNAAAYEAQRPQLGVAIAQELNLPATLGTPAVPFASEDLRLLFSSEAALAQVQRLLGQTASLPVLDTGVQASSREMEQAVVRWRTLSLVAALELTPGQISALQPLVARAGERRQAWQEFESSRKRQAGAQLDPLISTLVAEGTLPPEIFDQWSALIEPLREERLTARREMTALLAQTPQYLTLAQANLTDWPSLATAQGPAAMLRELQDVAAEMVRGREFFDSLRRLPPRMYGRLRVLRIRDFVAQYLPQNSPETREAESWVLELVTEAKTTPRTQWEQVAPALVTRLMIGLGAVAPAPGSMPATDRPLLWSEVFDILTAPPAGRTLETLRQALPAG